LALTVSASGAVGTAPTTVYVAGGTSQTSFQFVAGAAAGAGKIAATLFSTVQSDVVVAPPASLASIEPKSVQLLEGATQTFTLTLDSPASADGLYAGVVVGGGAGAAPAIVHVPAFATSTDFTFTATNFRTRGTLTVSSENALDADVSVVPPTTIDLSGWTIVQQNSLRAFVVPKGTVLSEGGYLVVGRKATQAQFESFWGRSLGADTVYVDGADQWPNINGSETFELRDAAGTSVDGPSTAMAAAGGNVYQRKPGTPAGVLSSWTSASATTVGNATPGAGQSAASAPAGVYVSEFADANGTGNFVYEFVEIHFDRLP
jgi:hypothetical protein